MAHTSPAGDEVQLAAGHVGVTVEQLERRIHARFGERGLTKAARDLGHLVALVESEAAQSRDRLRRTTLAARALASRSSRQRWARWHSACARPSSTGSHKPQIGCR